jgi:hypothetical protein
MRPGRVRRIGDRIGREVVRLGGVEGSTRHGVLLIEGDEFCCPPGKESLRTAFFHMT